MKPNFCSLICKKYNKKMLNDYLHSLKYKSISIKLAKQESAVFKMNGTQSDRNV